MLAARVQSSGVASSRRAAAHRPICSGHTAWIHQRKPRGAHVVYAEEGPSPSKTTTTPEEDPLWVRREKQRAAQEGQQGIPWPLYLVASVLVSIAAVGSVFEYFDRNPVFGVIPPDSPLWAPVLGLFAFTGIPTAGFLFFKGVTAANKAAEEQDRMDGYIE